MTDSDDDRAMLESIGRWAEKELRPIARKFDHADEYPAAIVSQMQELGLFGATIRTEYGGLGLTAATYARIVSLISSIRCELKMPTGAIQIEEISETMRA